MRTLELFCGIGGCAAALADRAEVVAAVDIDRLALEVYSANFPHPTRPRAIESLSTAELASFGADLWWMSPPCQPFTRRGLGRDDEDPRSRGLLALIGRIAQVRPPALALENVPGFAGSRTHRRLREALSRAGYRVAERLLCPTELGIPNRRRRFFLVAVRDLSFASWACAGDADEKAPAVRDVAHTASPAAGTAPRVHPAAASAPPVKGLASFLDPEPDPALWCESDLAARYAGALDVVEPDDPAAVAACFTAAYGRSPVRSGSYLRTPRGLRRFSPAEILRLLAFPDRFRLPAGLPLANAWRLAGNSLSVAVVREVLSAVPGLERAEPPAPPAATPGASCAAGAPAATMGRHARFTGG
jgi:site-specific DNA-cytosine methylase